MESISERLKYLRNSHNLTRKEVSDSLDLLQATYNRYENGLRVPDNEIILRFAKYYDVSPTYMFGFGHLQNEAEYYKEILEHISENGDSDGSYARIALEEFSA